MGDVRAQGSTQAALAGRDRHDPEVRGSDPVIGFGAEKQVQETEAGRRIPVIMVEVAEPAAGRGQADGTMVLAIEIMEHAGGEDEENDDDHGLFHSFEIIPRPAAFVNATRELDLGGGKESGQVSRAGISPGKTGRSA